MNREYDLFEQFPDNSVYWRARVCGAENARMKLRDLVKGAKHCFFAINLQTRETISLDGENGENCGISPEILLGEESAREVETVD